MRHLLAAFSGAAITLWATNPCLAVELMASAGVGGPTGRFETYDSKADFGPTLGAAVEQRCGLWGVQLALQAAFLEGEDKSLLPNENPGLWEFSARQLNVMMGPT